MSTHSSWQGVVKEFQPFSLDVLANYSAVKRSEQKYLLSVGQLSGILLSLNDDYMCLDINSIRLFNYASVYLDTADYQMYLAHHNGKQTRYKIRYRHYLETKQEYIEVKQRRNDNRLLKHRIKLVGDDARRKKTMDEFIPGNSSFYSDELAMKLMVTYTRITLMHKTLPLKLTFDFDIAMRHGSNRVHLPNLLVGEMKMYGNRSVGFDCNPFSKNAQQRSGISKYCIGLVLLKPDIKYNTFKPVVRKIEKITNIIPYASA